MADCYIGIDSGTQSTKALVIDGASGRVLGSAARKYDLIAGLPTGNMEQAPQDWIDAIQQTIPEALKTARSAPKRSEPLESAANNTALSPSTQQVW